MKKTILYLMVPIILCVNALGQGTEKKTVRSVMIQCHGGL